MVGGRVGADGGADVGDRPSVHPGRHERWMSEDVRGVVVDGREFGERFYRWFELTSEEQKRRHRRYFGPSRYFSGQPLPPPRADHNFERPDGSRWVVAYRDEFWQYVPEPPAPVQGFADGGDLRGVPSAAQGGSADVSRVSHRVWQDFGTDGVRRWPRWWCSCGAHGQGWPTSHPEES